MFGKGFMFGFLTLMWLLVMMGSQRSVFLASSTQAGTRPGVVVQAAEQLPFPNSMISETVLRTTGIAPDTIAALEETTSDAPASSSSRRGPAPSVEVATVDAPPPSPAESGAARYSGIRHVYIDAGANWANTLRLYEDIAGEGHGKATYEVYAFEANPYIATYVDSFARWLNRGGSKPPILIPPAGSLGHLMMLADRYGCDSTSGKKHVVACVQEVFRKPLSLLPLNISLRAQSLISERLAEAAKPLHPLAAQSRYTLVPAGVGGKAGILPVSKARAREVLITGGNPMGQGGEQLHIPLVNFVEWISKHFSEQDYVVLKMDAESAEHSILTQLIKLNKFGLLDVLAFECHPRMSKQCARLEKHIAQAAMMTGTRVLMENNNLNTSYQGLDFYSTPDKYFAVDPRTR
ncbi:unnamed protein product [Polarella glacialis]|uniref:Methyltransferase FkbM domain-containing protein n=1 Tax=Polarella glacialis TaxID=89957 RepID=A0A813E4A0_POLGL|nr:unnamed protein product [Polarella glacialis]